MSKLREIIKSLYDYAVNSAHYSEEYDEFYNKRVNTTIQEIQRLIPKKKIFQDFNNDEAVKRLQDAAYQAGKRDGYNQALDDVQKALFEGGGE